MGWCFCKGRAFRTLARRKLVMENRKTDWEALQTLARKGSISVKKEEVDIYEVNLTLLATQFIEHIDTMRLLDLEIADQTMLFQRSR